MLQYLLRQVARNTIHFRDKKVMNQHTGYSIQNDLEGGVSGSDFLSTNWNTQEKTQDNGEDSKGNYASMFFE